MTRPDKTFASFMKCLRTFSDKGPEVIGLIQTAFGGGNWNVTDAGELRETLQDFLPIAEGSHRLSVDMDTVPEATYGEHDISRLPYPVMLMHYQNAFEDGTVYDTILIAAEDEEHECTIILPFLCTDRPSGLWIPYMFRVQVNWNSDFVADGVMVRPDMFDGERKSRIAVAELPGVSIAESSTLSLHQSASEIFHALDDVLVLINCMNVELEAIEPTRLKLARARKKGELVERYSVIKLPGHSKTYKGSAGGHHASPTLHTRRGHYRRHRTDHSQRSWVRPCVVGDLGDGGGVTRSEYKV